MANPAFPDVPNVPGVPSVNRVIGTAFDTEPELAADGITVTATAKDQWGIYDDAGAKVLDADTVLSVGFDGEYRLADYPIEEGSFATYDKVALPFMTRIVMTKGGTRYDRRDFIAKIENIRGKTDLYNVVTPERTYIGVNIARVSIDRSREQGANLITAEIVLQEIRLTATATLSNSAAPSGADTKSNGSVQPQAADAATTATVAAKSAAVPGKAPFFASGAGKTLATIPTIAGIPAQAIATQLLGKSIGITLAQKATGLFADVVMNGKPLATGVLCRDAARIISGSYLGFPGDLAFFDMEGALDPSFADLGSRFKLMWSL